MECKDILPIVKDLLPLLGTLTGVGLGWLLNSRTARRARLVDLKIENYAEWAAGMEQSLHDYATQLKESANPYRTPLCEKRLLIIEDSGCQTADSRDTRQHSPVSERGVQRASRYRSFGPGVGMASISREDGQVA
jgi:hypothetical protein